MFITAHTCRIWTKWKDFLVSLPLALGQRLKHTSKNKDYQGGGGGEENWSQAQWKIMYLISTALKLEIFLHCWWQQEKFDEFRPLKEFTFFPGFAAVGLYTAPKRGKERDGHWFKMRQDKLCHVYPNLPSFLWQGFISLFRALSKHGEKKMAFFTALPCIEARRLHKSNVCKRKCSQALEFKCYGLLSNFEEGGEVLSLLYYFIFSVNVFPFSSSPVLSYYCNFH